MTVTTERVPLREQSTVSGRDNKSLDQIELLVAQTIVEAVGRVA